MDWTQIASSNNLLIIKQNVLAHIYIPFDCLLFHLTFHHHWEVIYMRYIYIYTRAQTCGFLQVELNKKCL